MPGYFVPYTPSGGPPVGRDEISCRPTGGPREAITCTKYRPPGVRAPVRQDMSLSEEDRPDGVDRGVGDGGGCDAVLLAPGAAVEDAGYGGQ
jgi:hypothetical protein